MNETREWPSQQRARILTQERDEAREKLRQVRNVMQALATAEPSGNAIPISLKNFANGMTWLIDGPEQES